ncbi:hypothetical protein A3I51_04675 [Candidatus Gottesmanbacteria bacterium RIFCSPLOWO2_02_FULL_38_8]|uniref:2TM domain-containing protein n=1 Tax=Candidatus Gottesmanbacteria bacterium RIFCSPLOWO2_02_FULL_38_8 TaxID=1798397 RepID=A0A1F6B3D9_9BACT|nr:MAG: hypothetical protein A3I51_04675 [Candidatus Gottesmanbacteria bacterium RIFCSPLOWO2_02_FULL_38_8]
MTKISELEREIILLKERNKRVETDKTWETSWTRRILLAVFTYLAISFYMYAISLPNPWINAIIPSIAFLLSTLTLPAFKNLWKNHLQKDGH